MGCKKTKTCSTAKQKERMARILNAARISFSEQEFHAVLMDDVARTAGVGKGTIYRYFPDKEHLYFAVIFNGVERLKQRIGTALPDNGSPEQTVRDTIEVLVTFLRRNRFFFKLMNAEDSKVQSGESENRKRWVRERNGLIDAIAQALVNAGESGGLDVRYPRTEARILMDMVRSVIKYKDDDLTNEQAVEELSRIFLYGLCAEKPAYA